MRTTFHGYLVPVLLLGGLTAFGANVLITGEGDEPLPRAARWSGGGLYISGGPVLDSGYKNWDLCAHSNRIESHPPLFGLPRWGPAAITGASGCGSCGGAASFNGNPKTAGLGLALAPPHDITGDPGQLPPSPTDHAFVLADTGEVVYTETDFVIPGTGFDFVFSRTYRSALDFEGWAGYGWTHSGEMVLIEETNGDLHAYLGDGYISGLYDWTGSAFTSPDGQYDLMERGTRGAGGRLEGRLRVHEDLRPVGQPVRHGVRRHGWAATGHDHGSGRPGGDVFLQRRRHAARPHPGVGHFDAHGLRLFRVTKVLYV